jgi:hypothetical protein
MKSTILIQLIALPSILASLQLAIVTQTDLSDVQDVLVAGKGDPDGKVLVMNNATAFLDHDAKCLAEDKTWTRWGCGGQNRTEYRQVAQFNFSEATNDPRPFVFHSPLRYNESDGYYPVRAGYWKAVSDTTTHALSN